MASNLISFNCKNIVRSVECVRKLCRSADIVALQETWLLPHDLAFLGTVDDDFGFTGTSAVDTSAGVLRGRPYGGVAILWRKSIFTNVTIVKCNSVRLAAIKIELSDRCLLIFSVYMPTDSSENLVEFTECLSEIAAIIEYQNVESIYMLGDFNAHPSESFAKELLSFCDEQVWTCVDLDMLPSDSYTFVSDAHGCRRWLDHCLVTSSAKLSIHSCSVLYNTYWSDHYPICLKCNFNILKPRVIVNKNCIDKVVWGERNSSQIDEYHNICSDKLRKLDFPLEFSKCSDKLCCDIKHRNLLVTMYDTIISTLSNAAECCYIEKVNINCKRKHVTG